MVFVKAFVIGGLICAAVQILMEKTKLMPGRIMVLLVCSGVVLGAVGLYEPIDESGFLGLFKGGFTACAVGVSSALIFGYISSWIFKPHMKKK